MFASLVEMELVTLEVKDAKFVQRTLTLTGQKMGVNLVQKAHIQWMDPIPLNSVMS